MKILFVYFIRIYTEWVGKEVIIQSKKKNSFCIMQKIEGVKNSSSLV